MPEHTEPRQEEDTNTEERNIDEEICHVVIHRSADDKLHVQIREGPINVKGEAKILAGAITEVPPTNDQGNWSIHMRRGQALMFKANGGINPDLPDEEPEGE